MPPLFQEANRYLQLMFEQMPEGVWIRSMDHQKTIYSNPAYARIIGKTQEDACLDQESESHLIHPEDREQVEKNRKKLIRGEQVKHHYRIVLPHQNVRWVREKCFALSYEEGCIAHVGYVEDVTSAFKQELKLKKKQEHAYDELIASFMMNFRHDLRTPFNGFVSLLDCIFHAEKDEQKKKQLEILRTGTKEFLDYFNGLLEFDNLKRGLQVLNQKVTFNLKTLVDKVVSMQHVAIISKGLELRYEFDPTIQPIVKSNQHKIRVMLMNLLNNAIKFTHSGYIDIDVRKIRQTQHTSVIRIAIKDTGIGIPMDKKDVIFEDFVRLTPSYKGHFRGQGIGLAIVKGFVKDLHADINVQSAVGVGTTFFLTLELEHPLETDLVDSIAPGPHEKEV